MTRTVAALFVQREGVYFGLPGVEPWCKDRDAMTYPGPYPVVAHPPCARWGRYWSGGSSHSGRFKLGDDGGMFAAAFAAVRRWGGVLEHPEASHAWHHFGIPAPPKTGGWVRTLEGNWTCCVEQGHYGHLARKATWLYLVGHPEPPALLWGKAKAKAKIDLGFRTTAERRRRRPGIVELQLSAKKRARTPEPFRDLLLQLARDCRPTDRRAAAEAAADPGEAR